MAIINDVMGLVRKGPELIAQANTLKLNNKSIVRSAKDATFQFPCLITDTVPVDMANTTRATLDKVYATYAQTVLSMNSMYDITIDPTPVTFLRRIHQNLSIESTGLEVDDNELEEYKRLVEEGSCVMYTNEDNSFVLFFNRADEDLNGIYESNKQLLREYMSDFDLKPLEVFNEANSDGTSAGDFVSSVLDGNRKNVENDRRETRLKDTGSLRTPRLTDRDVKRSNDLLPLGIEVRLLAVNDKKEFVQYVDIIVGIKAVLHLIKSDDMINNIVRAMQNKNLIFKFLRWTTGEISLVKDIILNLDNIKTDATATSGNRSPFFSHLKKLKEKRVTFRNGTVPTGIVPSSTIVITSYEADYIRNNFGIDLYDDATAVKLLSALFLMSFIIVDEGTNSMRAMYDGDKTFQVFSMDTLERENTLNQNKLGREIGRMIAK